MIVFNPLSVHVLVGPLLASGIAIGIATAAAVAIAAWRTSKPW